MEKVKAAYLLWFEYYQKLPKSHRYSLGLRIDNLLIDCIETTVTASFLCGQKKIPFVQISIRKLDTIKIMLLILWETKSLDHKRYILLSEKFNEIGRMLGGWYGKLIKENSPVKLGEK